jgi:hypothetical protein
MPNERTRPTVLTLVRDASGTTQARPAAAASRSRLQSGGRLPPTPARDPRDREPVPARAYTSAASADAGCEQKGQRGGPERRTVYW